MKHVMNIDKDGICGSVEIDIPKFSERMAIVKSTEFHNGVKVDDADKVLMLVDLAKQKAGKVELKHESGVELKSIDDLEFYQEGLAIIYEVAGIILNGVPLGNSLKK
jgi:hypothetical protein